MPSDLEELDDLIGEEGDVPWGGASSRESCSRHKVRVVNCLGCFNALRQDVRLLQRGANAADYVFSDRIRPLLVKYRESLEEKDE